jgi:hypothetical protein
MGSLGLGVGFYKLGGQEKPWDPRRVKGGGNGSRMMSWFRNNVGVAVSQWTDQSGAGNHIVQEDSDKQPSLSGGGLDFNASETDHMDFSSQHQISSQEGFVVMVVAELDNISSNRALLGLTGGTAHFMEFKAGGDNIRIKLGTTLTDIAPSTSNSWAAGSKFLCTLVRESGSTGNLILYKNGGKLAQSSQATNTGDGEFNSFAARNNDRPFEGKIYEFMFFESGTATNNDLTAVELDKIHTYLCNKHGISRNDDE